MILYDGLIFKNRIMNEKKLEKYGFKKKKDIYRKEIDFLNNEFKLIVEIKNNEIRTNTIENSSGEEFNLVYVKSAQGEFIGQVKNEIENILEEIKDECFDVEIFKFEYSKKVIQYIEKKYGAKAEYLWEKFPNNAVFRKKDKWFAAILTTKKDRFIKNSTSEIEVINLKDEPKNIEALVDNKKYFNAYHMNKKHWYSIMLDKSVDIDEIYKRIDISYNSIKQ